MEPRKGLYARFGKRALDATLAAVLLVLLGPVLLGAMAFVRWRSPGPVLFRQKRVGEGMRPFPILKLRTMHLDAERTGTGSVTIQGDPRLYRGAATLRATKIDEMPQLLNILRGEMSFVGPRPTVMEDYDRMTPAQRRRSDVPPGLTGLAQVNGGTALSWPQRIELDLTYIHRLSLATDLKLLARTAWLVLSRRVDTHPATADEWSQQ